MMDASPDEVIGLAQALEQQRAVKIAEAVEGLADRFYGPFRAGFEQACEEIIHRLKTEVWELCLPPINAEANQEAHK